MEIQITVNGSKCKQYNFNGKTYIEAKQGSEYVIEVKNNHYKRTLAVGSVDGLNVLTGKTASENDSGYIIGAYSAEKIKGFRFSDDEWALFKFGYKFNGNTYAQSKEDGSEKNCGVIGLRFFYEKEPDITYNQSPVWYSMAGGVRGITASYSCGLPSNYTSNVNYQSNNLGTQDMNLYSSNISAGGFKDCCQNLPYDKISKKKSSNKGGGCSAGPSATLGRENTRGITANYCSTISDDSLDFSSTPVADFDMGTEWGRKERSKVRTVEFIRGSLAKSFDIYYASREALIAMGVPITNELTVNLPQSFPDKYATPPKNWVG